MNRAQYIIVAIYSSILLLINGGLALAKGGQVSSPMVLPTTAGPCAFEWITDTGHVLYPMQHNTNPGVVSVEMTWESTNAPKVTNVCLDEGWTVESKAVTGGVQLRFNYLGVKAIDFKFVLGKTDIRYY